MKEMSSCSTGCTFHFQFNTAWNGIARLIHDSINVIVHILIQRFDAFHKPLVDQSSDIAISSLH